MYTKIILFNSISFVLCRPWAKTYAMSHDSYFCKKYKGDVHPFRTKRPLGAGNFVGAIVTNNDSITGALPLTKEYECPKECRPISHPDWKYC